MYNQLRYADVVKLADTPDLGSGASGVQVQVLSSAPCGFRPEIEPQVYNFRAVVL